MNDDLMNYLLDIYALNSTNVTISLETLHGESHLYLKKCNEIDYEKCKVSYEEIGQC